MDEPSRRSSSKGPDPITGPAGLDSTRGDEYLDPWTHEVDAEKRGGKRGRWEAPGGGGRVPAPAPGHPSSPAPGTGESDSMKNTVVLADLLVGMLEYDHPIFRGGSSLVRKVAVAIAEELGVSSRSRDSLALAAVLRDLGRLSLGDELLERPRTDLDPEDRGRIEGHVTLGLELLDRAELPVEVRSAIRHHHERWDGEGYPDGLSAEEIPLPARILAVADSLVAMIQPRPWRAPMRIPAALDELREEAGRRYDPTVVGALVSALQGHGRTRLAAGLREHVILVHPDHGRGTVLATRLCSAGFLGELATSIPQAHRRIKRVPLDALVVAVEEGRDTRQELLSQLAGEEGGDEDRRPAAREATTFVKEVRAQKRFASVPILVLGLDSPESRIELLDAGADVCFPPDAHFQEIQGTLAALLTRTGHPRVSGQSGDEPSGPDDAWYVLEGDLRTFPLAWLLQALQYDGRTGAISIESSNGHHGLVYVEAGVPRHARVRDRTGEDALRLMLRWSDGRFHVEPDIRSDERTIETGIMQILLDEAFSEERGALFGDAAGA